MPQFGQFTCYDSVVPGRENGDRAGVTSRWYRIQVSRTRSGLWSWNVRMRSAVSSTEWIDSCVRSRACPISVWASRIRRRVGVTCLFYEMPGAGIEPARSLWDLRILSPMRLPVPPPRRESIVSEPVG